MIGIQVLESVPYTKDSYPQQLTSYELALMWLNANIWKIKNPNTPLIFYTDDKILELLNKYNISDSWSEINTDLLKSDIGINKSIFWSNSKLRVYKELNNPFLFIDCDILIWDSISDWNIFNYDLVTSYKEDLSLSCYTDSDIIISDYEINYDSNWKNMPLNASLVYLNNKDLKDKYTNIGINWMKKCSVENKNLNKYSVYFIEQRFLAELAIDMNVNQKTLLSTFNTGKGWNKSEEVDGLWNWQNSYNHIYHIGYDKVFLRKNTDTYNEKYVKWFLNYIIENCKKRGFENLIPRFLELTSL